MKYENSNLQHKAAATELPPILRSDDLADALGISVVAARRMLARGDLPSRRLGKRRYLLREELLGYLRKGSSRP